jgi:uncharacterized protein (TIGR00296 family)
MMSLSNELVNGATSPSSPMVKVEVGREHCFYCFDVLASHLQQDWTLHEELHKWIPIWSKENHPLFVTWELSAGDASNEEYALRGCIGVFTPIPLHQGLHAYSLNAATKDPRFRPISWDEFPKLHCSVSILNSFESTQQWDDWDIQEHGIRISFTLPENPDHRYSSTYLPGIAYSQGWNHRATLESLMRKAGYNGRILDKDIERLHIERFQSSKLRVSYHEYWTWRSKNP